MTAGAFPDSASGTRSTGFTDRLRWLLLVSCLLMVPLGALFGERLTDFGDLRQAVAAGQVRQVWATDGIGTGSTGCSTQQLHWRNGALPRRTEVVIQSSGEGYDCDHSATRLLNSRDAVTPLRALQPGLRVTRVRSDWSSSTLFGWSIPHWLGLAGLGLQVLGVIMLIHGPTPWRATRWGWFWVMVNPLGTVAFALLGGPTPPLPAPRLPHRVLTGGWAFFLMLVLGGFAKAWS